VATNNKRKQSLYFPEEFLREIQSEANRQDRSLSWIVQRAWQLARGEIARIPGMNDLGSSSATRSGGDGVPPRNPRA
jgi:uncharacterized small protein (TIGR04563 family)